MNKLVLAYLRNSAAANSLNYSDFYSACLFRLNAIHGILVLAEAFAQ
jgi:hypothetical protein